MMLAATTKMPREKMPHRMIFRFMGRSDRMSIWSATHSMMISELMLKMALVIRWWTRALHCEELVGTA